VVATSTNTLVGECGMKERCDYAVIMQRKTVLCEHDVCYLSVLLELRYKEHFRYVQVRDSSHRFLREEEWSINV
jgi:hypothetical protein